MTPRMVPLEPRSPNVQETVPVALFICNVPPVTKVLPANVLMPLTICLLPHLFLMASQVVPGPRMPTTSGS
jgi:hypothetical protein